MSFKPGDYVRWTPRAQATIIAGTWVERDGVLPTDQELRDEATRVRLVIDAPADDFDIGVTLDIEPDHPFFNDPVADETFLELVAPLELLGMEAQ